MRAIAREMKADTNTIIKYLQKLGLNESSSTSEPDDDEVSTPMLHNELGKLYANNMVSYMFKNNQASRTMIRSEFQKEYTWLYRHNKELLFFDFA